MSRWLLWFCTFYLLTWKIRCCMTRSLSAGPASSPTTFTFLADRLPLCAFAVLFLLFWLPSPRVPAEWASPYFPGLAQVGSLPLPPGSCRTSSLPLPPSSLGVGMSLPVTARLGILVVLCFRLWVPHTKHRAWHLTGIPEILAE